MHREGLKGKVSKLLFKICHLFLRTTWQYTGLTLLHICVLLCLLAHDIPLSCIVTCIIRIFKLVSHLCIVMNFSSPQSSEAHILPIIGGLKNIAVTNLICHQM